VTAMAFEAAADEWEAADAPPRWATPGELALAVDPSTVQTAALDLIDGALVDVAEGRCRRLIISLPPQEGKSSRTTRFGVLWMLSRNPDLRVGIVSYADRIAEQFSYQIRSDIATFDGTDGNPDLGLRLRRDSKAASRWYLEHPRKGGVYAIGVGGSLTGRPVDLLVIDDPVKDYRAADSTLLSELAWQWWMSVARPRLAPNAPVCVILTRWHEADLAGRLLAKQAEDEAAGAEHYDKWRVINIPAIADHDPAKGEADPLGREPGEWLVSARGRTAAQWEATRIATAPRIWSALYQGRPSPDQGGVWQRHWWRRYREPLWSQHPEVPGAYLVREADEMVMSWDMAFKDTKSSDYVVGQVWARRGADVFLLDQVHKRLSFTDTLTAFKALCARWPQASRRLVEDKANGTAVISTLGSKIPGIAAVSPTDSKYGRATAVAPFVQAGNVLLPDPAVALFDTEAFVDECASFPNGAHDDQVDATSQALAEMLLDGNGAAAWIAWAKEKAEQAAAGSTGDALAAASRAALASPPPGLKKCGKPDCGHLTSAGSAFCCRACSDAAAGMYEIHAHDPGCDERTAGRAAEAAQAVVPLTPEEARRAARNAAFRGGQGAWR
jgi:predicted phage terminase large subunit-like protein